jgi:spectinomycin phosphotransferase
MKTQLPIKVENLTAAIEQYYPFTVQALTFKAEGWGGYSYFVTDSDGNRYFLKLQNETHTTGIFAANSPDFYLSLIFQLHQKKLVNLPKIILTKTGDFSAQFADFKIVIYAFITGREVGFRSWPEGILPKLADQVGKLHASRPLLNFEHPFIENFQIAFETELLEYLSILKPKQPENSSGLQKLRAVLHPRQDVIQVHLKRLLDLQFKLRQRDHAMVICHTDLHGGNLMTDEAGKLFLLDWENAMIAPPEHDLFFWAGDEEQWEQLWPIYCQEMGEQQPDCNILEFHFLRRALEDVADFVKRILREAGSEARDADDIDEIVGFLDWMPKIPDILKRF